jgi:hypothetical protein
MRRLSRTDILCDSRVAFEWQFRDNFCLHFSHCGQPIPSRRAVVLQNYNVRCLLVAAKTHGTRREASQSDGDIKRSN